MGIVYLLPPIYARDIEFPEVIPGGGGGQASGGRLPPACSLPPAPSRLLPPACSLPPAPSLDAHSLLLHKTTPYWLLS
jgi:hypothetical protein